MRTGTIVTVPGNWPGTLTDTESGALIVWGTGALRAWKDRSPAVGDSIGWEPIYAFNGAEVSGPAGVVEPAA
jgi:hypothetical protein